MTPDELRKVQDKYPVSTSVARLNTEAPSPDRADQDRALGPKPPVTQPAVLPPAPQKVPHQKSHPARFLVRLTDYRVRLLDEDNLCPKYHVDTCRYCDYIPTDAPGRCKIEVRQEKVFNKKDIRVEIEIVPPEWEGVSE